MPGPSGIGASCPDARTFCRPVLKPACTNPTVPRWAVRLAVKPCKNTKGCLLLAFDFTEPPPPQPSRTCSRRGEARMNGGGSVSAMLKQGMLGTALDFRYCWLSPKIAWSRPCSSKECLARRSTFAIVVPTIRMHL